MKNKLDKHRGFIIKVNYLDLPDLMLIPNHYIELMLLTSKTKNLFYAADTILNTILLNRDDIIYINDEDLFKKITQLIESDNRDLVKSMLNTIKEFENENEKNKRIEKFNKLIE
jgi:hypothetical protein